MRNKLSELLLYNVDIEPNNIQSYTNNNSVNFLKKTYIDTIKVSPTLFIFYQINCIFVIYQEINNSFQVNKTKRVAFSKNDGIRLRSHSTHTKKSRS